VNAERRHFETGARAPEPNGNTERTIDRLRTAETLPAYDTVIAGGERAAPDRTRVQTGGGRERLVYLAADETFYTLRAADATPLARSQTALEPAAGRRDRGRSRCHRWARPYIGDVPVAYVRPPIADEKYERLASLSPNSPQDPFTILGGRGQTGQRVRSIDPSGQTIRRDRRRRRDWSSSVKGTRRKRTRTDHT